MAGELDDQYVQEFQELINHKSEQGYTDQDPMMLVYSTLADMVVVCTRLYISLRVIEAEFDRRIAEHLDGQ